MFRTSLPGNAARLEIQSHASSAPYSSSPPLVLSCSGYSRGACLILNLGGLICVCLTYGHFFLTSALITTCYTVKIRRTGSFYVQSGKVIPYGWYTTKPFKISNRKFVPLSCPAFFIFLFFTHNPSVFHSKPGIQ